MAKKLKISISLQTAIYHRIFWQKGVLDP